MSLTLRKKEDGSLSVIGKVPDEHTLQTGFVSRHLGDAVEVTVVLKTAEGDVRYGLVGFEGNDPSKEISPENPPNWTAWKVARLKKKAAKS